MSKSKLLDPKRKYYANILREIRKVKRLIKKAKVGA